MVNFGRAHNMVTAAAFHEMLVGITGNPNVTAPSSKTYNDILDNHFENCTEDAADMFIEEFKELDETPFMTVEHDLWTNSAKNSIVGVSGSYINHQWRPTDCAMHALNLCIGYGIGLKENVHNEYKKDPKSEAYVKTRAVVTRGGDFPEGGAVIRKLRALNIFFASSKSMERITHLKEVQTFHKLPQLAALVDIDGRVASTIKLFQRSIINFSEFQAFSHSTNMAKDEKHVFNRINDTEWALVIPMEAVMQCVAELALVEAQSPTMLSSTMYLLLRVAPARMNSYKFSAYRLNCARDTDTNEKNFPRPSVPMDMALLLDSRAKSSANPFLRVPDTSEAATDKILEGVKALMRVEHRVFFKGLYARDKENASNAPYEESSADAVVNAKADAMLDQWFNLRVEWAEVAKRQYSAKD
ncbi:Hypothetical protein PHPALM_10550, partial [Phytophthora palmivora]